MEDFQRFIHDLGAALHAKNLKLMVALPAADWSYDYKYIASQCDAIILMNYDFHWPTSPPGPIAPQDWYVRDIDNILKIVPADKIVMGIANYSLRLAGQDQAESASRGPSGDVPAGRGDGRGIGSLH